MRRLLLALAMGIVIVALANHDPFVRLSVPGGLAALFIPLPRTKGFDWFYWTAAAINVLLYSVILYVVLSVIARLRRKGEPKANQ